MQSKTQQSKCSFCNESGHYIAACQILQNFVCPICKKTGHTKKRCPKYDPTHIQKFECGFCRTNNLPFNGHTKYNCEVLKTTQCKLCDEFGHTGSVCELNDFYKPPSKQNNPSDFPPITPTKTRSVVVAPAAPKKNKNNMYNFLDNNVVLASPTKQVQGMLYSDRAKLAPVLPPTPVKKLPTKQIQCLSSSIIEDDHLWDDDDDDDCFSTLDDVWY